MPSSGPAVSEISADNPPVATEESQVVPEVTTEVPVDVEKEIADAMIDLPPQDPQPSRPSTDEGIVTSETTEATGTDPPGTPSKKLGIFGRIRKTFSPMARMLRLSTSVPDHIPSESNVEEEAKPVEPPGQANSPEEPKETPSIEPAQEVVEPVAEVVAEPTSPQSPVKLGIIKRLQRSIRLVTRRKSEVPTDAGLPQLSKQDRIKKMQESTIFKESVDSVESKSTIEEQLTPGPARNVTEETAQEQSASVQKTSEETAQEQSPSVQKSSEETAQEPLDLVQKASEENIEPEVKVASVTSADP